MRAVRTAIGLMSGTSMDGIDAAVLVTDGEGVAEPGASIALSYEPALRAELREALAIARDSGDADATRARLADCERCLTDLNAEAVLALLAKAGLGADEVDVVGYHGQTVLHRPEDRVTIQLGDGARLACRLGIPVVNDFRAADVAAGGEGAPFAPAYHRALAAKSGPMPQAVVNIGGVANVTWLPADADPIAFDTGPGNALLDDLIRTRTGRMFDEGGAIAGSGRVDRAALGRLLDDRYFDRPPPKSLDRDAFPPGPIDPLGLADAAATLVAFTVQTIVGAARFMPAAPRRWVVCGGGRRNGAIMAGLRAALGAPVLTAEEAGWRGDDVEAEAFAYLAVRSLDGLPLSWPTTTGVPAATTGGVLHEPQGRPDTRRRRP